MPSLTTRNWKPWALAAGLAVSASLAQAQDLARALEARESVARNLTFHWNYQFSYREEAPSSGSSRKHLEETTVPPGLYYGTGSITIKRRGRLSVVQGDQPSVNTKSQSVIAEPFLNFATPEAVGRLMFAFDPQGKPEPYIAEVSGTRGGGLKTYSPFFSPSLQPLVFPFLAGESPIGCYMVPWNIAGESEGRAVISGRNYEPSQPNTVSGRLINDQFSTHQDFKCDIDLSKMAPSSFLISEEGGQCRTEARVTQWAQDMRLNIPKQVEVLLYWPHRSSWVSKVVWNLQGVEPTKNLELPVPKGLWVADFRTFATDVGFPNFPPPKGSPAKYRFAGLLPNVDQLQGLATIRRSGEVPARNSFPQLLAGVAAVLLGTVLIVRSTRTKRLKLATARSAMPTQTSGQEIRFQGETRS